MTKAKTKPSGSGMTLAGLYGLVHRQHGESEGRLNLQASALSHIRDSGTANTNKIQALEEAICPRVAARLTVLERSREIQIRRIVALERGQALERLRISSRLENQVKALEEAICPHVEPAKPALPIESEAARTAATALSQEQLGRMTWTAATALSQEQLGHMIQSLQRVYWKKRLATEK